ncbi:lipoprotein-releasing ABC transporter permease subunit [Shewanella cyperi]|uniref:lipoprotein-releasing ABC transporter permease subunit n=1 Tax=Shewanella cyperi TaxID=2814292 RepID=UPI001A953628|nr:lipoprotein-releasing ABC transporter permease subunit [Shewanella cyperi]QSX42114.1 lipoprotein-releasing ABC transporter permease subunit [Shewanella cyperi]
MTPAPALFIGYRYWRSRKANAFASFITLFAVSGIFLGVTALILVSSVMNGLEDQLKQRILGAVPQLILQQEQGFEDWQSLREPILAVPGVRGVVPFAATQAMVQSPSNISAVQLQGIVPDAERQLSAVMSHSYADAFDALEPGEFRIILGSVLANQLDVAAGDTVRVLSGDGVVYSPLGPVPSQRKFVVAGVFQMGSPVDANSAFVHLADARRLMRRPAQVIDSLRLYLDDPFAVVELTPKLQDKLHSVGQEVSISDWRDSYGHLFSAVKMEKNMMSLMLSLIVAVAAFNIVSALVMMVVDKTTDVAVLRTQGLGTLAVMGIFMVQGSLNALLGLLLGLLVGTVMTFNINPILDTLGISVLGPGQPLPVVLQWSQLGLIVAGTVLLSLGATLYPALRAAGVQPATALRYE